MGRVQIIRHPTNREAFIIVESDGTKTIVRNGYAGMAIEQRRPDGKKGTFSTYEEYGMSLYPHLLRLLISTHQTLPKIPLPKIGNDDFAPQAANAVEYALMQTYPYTVEDPGFGGKKENTIRAIHHPHTQVPGLLISETGTGPVFLSSEAARAVLVVLPRIYPRYSSYHIMEKTIRQIVTKGRFKKIVFETGTQNFHQQATHPPLRARKGFGKIIKRYVRIQKRRN